MRHPARLLGIGCNLFSAIGLRLADLRHPTGLASQRVEVRLGCKILNTMTALGIPDGEMIG